MKKHIADGGQLGLFPVALAATITLNTKHPYVQIADFIDWTTLLEQIQQIRKKKLKSPAGKKPHLRQLIGALIVKGLANRTFRDTEDCIRYYLPARYLCKLMDSEWTPDYTTIQDFAEMIGEDGCAAINEHVVGLAVVEKFADPSAIAADLTAQEASIPYPNEVGLMMQFLSHLSRIKTNAKGALTAISDTLSKTWKEAKLLERSYRFFAKTQEQKRKITRKLMQLTERALRTAKENITAIGETLRVGGKKARKGVHQLKGEAKKQFAKFQRLTQTMNTLLPQIRSWWKSGKVAAGKIVSLTIPEVYAIVRGKVGKAVEFGVTWGITRMRGGFITATRARDSKDICDSKYALQTVDEHIRKYGQAPESFAYDRGAYCTKVIDGLKAKGVQNIAVAPRGKGDWLVSGETQTQLMSERAQTEGVIGAIKRPCYGFNKPRARTVAMMRTYGQLAVTAFNLNKLIREKTKRAWVLAQA